MARARATRADETAVIVTTAEGVVLEWNSAAESLYGYPASEALGRDVAGLIVPEQLREEERRRVDETLAAGGGRFESLRRTKTGTFVYAAVSYTLDEKMGKAARRVTFTEKDITRLRVERDHALIRARHGDLLETIPDGVVIIGPTGHIIFVNSRVEELFGYGRAELHGTLLEALLPTRFRSSHIVSRLRYFSKPTRRTMGAELACLHRDGSEFPAEITLSPLSIDSSTFAMSVIRDISERKRIAGALEESELKFRQLAESINEVFFLVNVASGETLYVSPAYETVFGRSCESLYARRDSWLEAVHPEDLENLRAALRANPGQTTALQYRIVRPDGSVGWIESRRFPIRNASGGIYRLAGIAADITERKLAETRIARLNRIYAVLSDINALIVRERDRDELFRETCRVAVEVGKFRLAWIGVVLRWAELIEPIAWWGAGEDYLKLMPLSLKPGSPKTFGLAGRAVNEGKPVVSDDMGADSRIALAREAAQRGLRGLALLPLIGERGVTAVLALYTAEPGFFDAEEMKLLEELSGDIAFALDHIDKEEKLDYLAYYDPLTELANPTLFRERLTQHITISATERRSLAVALMDIDRFKTINDSFGRQAGDRVLKQCAARLSGGPGRSGAIARLGADEFAIVLPDIRQPADVVHALDDVHSRCFADPFVVGSELLNISVKTGVAVYPDDGRDAETLLNSAEVALRRARTSGEARVFYTHEMTSAISQRINLENSLRQAVEREEFVLHYQPKVDLESRRIHGVEALLRWQSPDRGLVPPAEFIPALEETGLIVEVGAWVVRRASLDYVRWMELGLPAPRIAVNVSAVQLRRPDFVDLFDQRPEGKPSIIDIEITESLIMSDAQGTIAKLERLRDLGIGIAIDDFGTGYSSLSYLGKLPVESVKIDRAFVVRMTDDPDAMTLVSTIISLAHSLSLKVTAEGVETQEQATMLRLLRCDEIQGYLIGRPVPFDELSRVLRLGEA